MFGAPWFFGSITSAGGSKRKRTHSHTVVRDLTEFRFTFAFSDKQARCTHTCVSATASVYALTTHERNSLSPSCVFVVILFVTISLSGSSKFLTNILLYTFIHIYCVPFDVWFPVRCRCLFSLQSFSICMCIFSRVCFYIMPLLAVVMHDMNDVRNVHTPQSRTSSVEFSLQFS